MNAAIARLKEWFAQLAPRERWMVLFCAVVVAVAVLYGGIWRSLVKMQQQREEALAAARSVATRIEELASLAQASQGRGAAVNRSASILSVVDQGARVTLGKQPTRIQPEGDREVKVWVEDVPFDSLLRWMQELELRYGIHAQAAELEKQPTPGMVSAQLSLVR
ncbi:type II secretion system protein M [Solimonas sp. K1W22B-7]|uniref:type II secretion system protein GspM n=1 Tax=Solimonas sp. K1W22B-7 TaxID=2303331 RepID=UPI000E32F75E|nr:type II secretion system protein M [Solimonas sp. K1W22B-7]AXQ29446.1 type II secretion system protein M [Solimonas sp. K1W22B-7]